MDDELRSRLKSKKSAEKQLQVRPIPVPQKKIRKGPLIPQAATSKELIEINANAIEEEECIPNDLPIK